MPRMGQLTVNVEGLDAVQKLAQALTEAVAILECDKDANCIHVQAQLDRGEHATAGTCWWSTQFQRLLPELPPDACRYCRTRDLLKRLAPVSQPMEGES